MAQHGDELVVLREVGTRGEADLLEALLKGAGIPCVVTAPSSVAYLTMLEPVRIRVLAGDLARAEAVIAESQPAEPAEAEDFCPFCGEYLGTATQSCPRCASDISEWVAAREEVLPSPPPAHMREHSTTWRFLVLLALAALAAMLLTPWGRQVGSALLKMAMEWARRAPQ